LLWGPGLRDGHSAECTRVRGTEPRQARHAVRCPLPRCAGLCPAGIRVPATDPTFRRSCDGRMKDINPRLGRGLASLLGDPTNRAEKEPVGEISITAMEPSPF